MEPNDLVLWVESHGALVAGDTLQDRGNSLQFLGDLTSDFPAHIDGEQVPRKDAAAPRATGRDRPRGL